MGDIIAAVGLPRDHVEACLDALVAADQGHLKVTESGEVVYVLGRRSRVPALVQQTPEGRLTAFRERVVSLFRHKEASAHGRRWLDRKTLRLIRARKGILSLAELVEHTGLPLDEAEHEMRRLVESYGGQRLDSEGGHPIFAFPELMVSALGRITAREPRPAWVRLENPSRLAGLSRRRDAMVAGLEGCALLAGAIAPWILFQQLGVDAPAVVLGLAVAPAIASTAFFARRLFRRLCDRQAFHFRQTKEVRRLALGYVYQVALAGKGIVSIRSTLEYLRSRSGGQHVKRSTVEAALRELAREFDATITDGPGDHTFFGFRNIKKQFVASEVIRRRMKLERLAHGRTVFDSADSPLEATARDLEAFDRELGSGN